MPADQQILITGATGFLGGHCVAELAKFHHVTATGRNPVALSALNRFDVMTEQIDLTTPGAAGRLAGHNPDVIVHAAALSTPWGRCRDFEAANVAGTETVLQAAVLSGAALVHISTPAIYMNGHDRLMIDEQAALPESFVNDYAATKFKAEQLVLASNVAAAILRPQAIIGAGDTSVAPRFERVARRGVFPVIRGCDPVLDMTHVRNVVAAIELCCKRLASPTWTRTETFNITNGDPRRLSELVSRFLEARNEAGIGGRVRRVRVSKRSLRAAARLAEATAFGGREPAITEYSVELLATSRTLDIDKARSVLGYDPAGYTVDDAFAEYFAGRSS